MVSFIVDFVKKKICQGRDIQLSAVSVQRILQAPRRDSRKGVPRFIFKIRNRCWNSSQSNIKA